MILLVEILNQMMDQAITIWFGWFWLALCIDAIILDTYLFVWNETEKKKEKRTGDETKSKWKIEIHKHLADFRFYDRNKYAINNSFVMKTSPRVYNMRSNTVHANITKSHMRDIFMESISTIFDYCDDDDNDHNNINGD